MTSPHVVHLELLAEIDAITGRLRAWADAAPTWTAAGTTQAVVRRVLARAESLRIRLEAPLVVATLGGTGTGKSSLVNALAGADVVTSGRARPTTLRPIVVCQPRITPELLGIDPASVEVVHRNLPALADLVLVDCPDPDTTEDAAAASSNLARLRAILPHCDVILVTGTQQKYRSARVTEELAAAAAGAQLVFVQTHADVDADVRDDWRRVLAEHYEPGELFFVDSVGALDEIRAGRQPRGEFARLLDLLTRQLAGAAGNRIRRANFLDLVTEALDGCAQRLDAALPTVEQVETAIAQQRSQLAARLASQTRDELITNRRAWETRLLGRAASRWGLSPFALVLRVFQGLGGLLSRAVLFRARTPAQMALWGAMEGARTLRAHQQQRRAERSAAVAAAGCWDAGQLRSAAIVLEGYALEAGLERKAASPATVAEEAGQSATRFAAEVGTQLEALIDRLAARHSGWFTRWRYEFLLLVMLGFLFYRLGKNFFYDSWLAAQPVPVHGMDFYLAAAFWLVLWSMLLFWMFNTRLRRGLTQQINELAQGWGDARPAAGVFARLEDECRRSRQFRHELEMLRQQTVQLRRRVEQPVAAGPAASTAADQGELLLGHRRM